MKTILVTGGAGFIGSHIVTELVLRGHQVHVLDDLSTGKLDNLSDVLDKITFVRGDIRNIDTVRQAMLGADGVMHLAAACSVAKSFEFPDDFISINIQGTYNVLDVAVQQKIKCLIFASSSSVYGDSIELPKHEEMTPQPKSPYAISKLAGEHLCRMFWNQYKLPTLAFRFFNVFGPRQNPASQYAAVIPKFIQTILKEEPVPIHGDGTQTRDFTFVHNIVNACILAFTEATIHSFGNVFNIACNKRFSLLDLIDIIAKHTEHQTVNKSFSDTRPGDIKDSLASILKAGEYLKYSPQISLTEGLVHTIKYYQDIYSSNKEGGD